MSRPCFRGFALTSLLLIASILLAGQRDTIRARVDLVVVPASVRDGNGKFVYDLRPEEFRVFEDGKPQEIRNFSIDPAPLSVAVLIDTGVGGKALRRFAASTVSLSSAFTDLDEVEVYRFDRTASKLIEFTNSQDEIEKGLGPIKKMAEGLAEPPPSPFPILPGRGPGWLRALLQLDSGMAYKDLNDALFASERDLEPRSAERRKIIMIVSDGDVADDATLFHKGTTIHSLKETQERLVQHQIQVYGVAFGNALFEGRTSILHVYADATGGDLYRGRTQNAMETAFSRITEQARHQYVISYVSNNEIPGLLPVIRKIEVKATRPHLTVNHRKTYLQYPPPK